MKKISHGKTVRIAGLALAVLAATFTQAWTIFAQAPAPATGVKYATISPADMKEWLTYLASDQLQGRAIFTEGYGLASQYIAERLKDWGVKPAGEDGTYFQSVKLKGYHVTRNSTVTIDANGQKKTFKHGDHVTFGINSGGKQTVTFTGVEFVGYGQAADLQGRDLKGKLVVLIPNLAPAVPGGAGAAGFRGAPAPAPGGGRAGGARGGAGGAVALGAKAAVNLALTPAAPTAAETALTQAQAALSQATEAVQQAQAQLQGRGRGGLTQAQIAQLTAAGLTPAQIAQLTTGAGRAGGGRGALPTADITTVGRVDGIVTPTFTGDETFYDALFGAGPLKFADIRAKAEKGEPIAPMSLPVTVTVSIDNDFEVISQQLSRNVVGMVEGSDPKLKDTYVLFGAHLDHVGYSQTGGGAGPSTTGCRNRSAVSQEAVVKAGKVVQRAPRGGGAGAGRAAGAPAAPAAGAPPAGAAGGQGAGAAAGRGAAPPANVVPFDQRDFVSNGADDDGSGSTAVLAVAKAFATGPKPKRSVVFVWHTGEESGLYGSRYNAEFPIVPLDKVQAQFNMDMVGRDDCDNIEGDYSNSVFIVGADRISTDLHNLIVQTNSSQMAKPLVLDYELNDQADPEGVYTRSDHYSYAQKGIPIAFFTTGLHPDYHRVSDTVDKITFPKMARIAQLVYQSGFSVANTDKVLERDNKGPQTGFGTPAAVIKK